MIMIGIKGVDAGPGRHDGPGDRPQLARGFLIQAPGQHLPHRGDAYPGRGQRALGAVAVCDQEVRDRPAVHGEQAAPLNADARTAQCLAHDSQPISPPAELDLQIKHRAHLPPTLIALTATTAAR